MQSFASELFGLSLSPRMEFDPAQYRIFAKLKNEDPEFLWKHYNQRGWVKGLKPNSWFDAKWYVKEYVLNADTNPFLHFCYIGCKYGASPNKTFREGLQEKISTVFTNGSKSQINLSDKIFSFDYEKYKLENLALLGFNLSVEEHFINIGIKTYKPIGEILQGHEQVKNKAPIEFSNNSFEFMEDFPFAYFNHQYYSDIYSVAIDKAWGDFKQSGYFLSRYPNFSTAIYDYLLLRQNVEVENASFYRKADLHRVLDYEITKQSDIIGGKGALETAYKTLFNDYFCHRAFVRRQHKMGIYETYKLLKESTARLKNSGILNTRYYAAKFDSIAPTKLHEHYLTYGQNLGLSHSPDFDLIYYHETYTDMVQHVNEPCLHYEDYGRNEGRLSYGGERIKTSSGHKKYYTSKKTILIFTHEASRTGAPIVALNIAKHLSKSYNVIVWSGKDGPLDEAFKQYTIKYLTGWSSELSFNQKLDVLVEKHKVGSVIINSIVCHPIIQRIAVNSLPILSLFHEFAFYVFPQGTSAKSTILSDHTILPANIVANSYIAELEDFHKVQCDTRNMLTVRPQGLNKTSLAKSELAEDDFIRKFKVNSKKVKIVLGAGQLGKRKGQDLFVQTAKHVIEQDSEFDWRFIWVGGNFDIKTDLENSLYLDYFIKQNNLQNNIFFVPHQNSLEIFYRFADIFFLSSRLDPYPNVVLDSIGANIPTIVFKGATGYEKLIAKYPKIIRDVDYGDSHQAAQEIINISRRKVRFTAKIKASLEQDLSFDSYINDIEDKLKNSKRVAHQKKRLTKKLSQKNYRELVHMAGQMPNYLFSKSSVYNSKDYAPRIANYFTKLKDIMVDGDSHFYSKNICDARYEQKSLSLGHTILCYAQDARKINAFLDIYKNLDIKFIVGSEDQLQNRKSKKKIVFLDGSYSSLIDIIHTRELALDTPYLTLLDLNDFTLSLNDPINNIMTGLTSGRFETYLEKNPNCDGIVAQNNILSSQTALSPKLDSFAGYFHFEKLKTLISKKLKANKNHQLMTNDVLKPFLSAYDVTINLNPWIN